ncbi:unnamed protein product [Linum trigynum]|uniref:Uncharacterized protein n=1 Tax=Linum trigynum TaxID=586398 RepID=A0AAV2E4A7_9ROSI
MSSAKAGDQTVIEIDDGGNDHSESHVDVRNVDLGVEASSLPSTPGFDPAGGSEFLRSSSDGLVGRSGGGESLRDGGLRDVDSGAPRREGKEPEVAESSGQELAVDENAAACEIETDSSLTLSEADVEVDTVHPPMPESRRPLRVAAHEVWVRSTT